MDSLSRLANISTKCHLTDKYDAMTDDVFGKFDITRWTELPHMSDSIAAEQDVKDGRAVFYTQLSESGQSASSKHEMDLPKCAIHHEENGQQVPIVIIQAEIVNENVTLGIRYPDGGNGVCLMSEVELLDEPDGRLNSSGGNGG